MGFWKGAIIGGIAGTAYGIWTAPGPDTDPVTVVVDTIESQLFKITGMEIWSPDRQTPTQPAYELLTVDPETEFGSTAGSN